MHDSLPGFVLAWTVMMAAMMLPSLVPSILLFRTVTAARVSLGFRAMPSPLFVLGYFVAWGTVGLPVGWLARFAPPGAPGMRIAVAAGLIVGGAWQLTSLKTYCLDHCRTPMQFLMHHWRDGPAGAVLLGIHHGLYCIGCCWGLMAAFVALGMMNVAWMGVFTIIILAEKLLPGGPRLARVIGILLILAGIAALAGLLPAGAPSMGDMHG